MQELGLLSDTSWLCLDQWEIQRDHVVLNRKLGEGAFGTVYGGEALIDDVWVAVAVKTLKIGSNPEEKVRRFKPRATLNAEIKSKRNFFSNYYSKAYFSSPCKAPLKILFFLLNSQLDFLSEAEMMKRFDHENIVKLLGVCTRGEPAYTIMEFMLHGNYISGQ